MKILIKNAILISMDESRKNIERNIDVLIKDDKIEKIGLNLIESELVQNDKNISKLKIIDATNKVVMPGLINTHSHVPMSIFRETIDGYDLQDWLNNKIWPMEDKLNNNDIYYASLLSFIEMIETGCTTINDMYFMVDEIIKAMKETGIRLQTTRTLMDMVSVEEGESRFTELLRLIKQYKNEPKLTFNCGIHGLYTANEVYVKKCIDFAKENNLNIHMHFCENSKEVEDIRQIYKKEPIDILTENFQNVHTLLAHAVKLNNQDIDKMKNMDISIAHCPISNLKLGCGVAKISEMYEKGINISLGTDGQGSGCSLDMFGTMKMAALLQKGTTENPKAISSYDALKMATINGAKALGLENEIGTIEEGKQADIIILDLNRTVTKPENDILSQIVYNTNGCNVETTIVGGKILMEERKLNINVDKEKIYLECEEIIKRIS